MRLFFLTLILAIVAAPATAATKTFNVTAHQFQFDFVPSPVVVNVGDTVKLLITAGDDGIGDGHGFFLEQYAEEVNTIRGGQTITIEFVASLPGVFTYFCTNVCGDGHSGMAGSLTVRESESSPPSISSFSPTRGPVTGGTSVTVLGDNFESAAKVIFGSVQSTAVTVSSPQRLVATAPAQEAGSVAIAVVNPDQKSGASQQLYTYEETAPSLSIASVTPSSGSSSGDTNLTITGSGFVTGASVSIGGIPAVNAFVVTPTSIQATTPVGPPDLDTRAPRDIVVSNPGAGSARLIGGFTWILPAPSIASIAPARGTAGATVTIEGAGFTTVRTVTVLFGGIPATNVHIVDAATLTATVPSGSGAVDVMVRRGDEFGTFVRGYTYDAARRRAVAK